MKELEPVSRLMTQALQRLGVADLEVLVDLAEHWDEVAGAPWAGQSRPVVLRHGELVVEAAAGPGAGLLRYAVGDLLRRLDERFPTVDVETVRVMVGRLRDRAP